MSHLVRPGIALGLYNPTTTSANISFVWSETLGFQSLASSFPQFDTFGDNFTGLSNAYYADLVGNIYGYGSASIPTYGNTNALVTLSAVPEPASLSLLGVGAMALLGRRRRRPN